MVAGLSCLSLLIRIVRGLLIIPRVSTRQVPWADHARIRVVEFSANRKHIVVSYGKFGFAAKRKYAL